MTPSAPDSTSASSASHDLDLLAINTIRFLAVDAVEKANSGHPGLPLGAAPMAYVLWQKHLRHNPRNPAWADRDRFILSAGHGSALIYSLLHLAGYDLSLDDLKQFRQWGSRTPGHPEAFMTKGVEATTGPLGQGTANAVGMAMAERSLAHYFNRPGHTIVDHMTYALVSDGDLMEGLSNEAAALAGHLGLGKLVYLYDANDVSLDGPTSLSFSEDVWARYEAVGWQVLCVEDGDHDVLSLDQAIAAARAEQTKPSLIIVHTTIGYGSPNKQGKCDSHGSPLGAAETKLTKQALGWPAEETFVVPKAVHTHMTDALVRKGAQAEADWNARFAAYAVAHPDLAKEWQQTMAGALPADWDKALPSWSFGSKAIATRVASGKVINGIAKHVPWFMGGDADLSCSTKTAIDGGGSFDGRTGAGRNIHFGVREHAMGSIANGMAYHGGIRPYVSTFFVFSDYMRPAIRLAALNQLPVTFVFTHDSIGLGEDGPTHQPIEHLMSLRAMPNLAVVRPADANETREAWRLAMTWKEGPVLLVLSRQDLPILTCGGAEDASAAAAASAAGAVTAAGVMRGAYVLSEAAGCGAHGAGVPDGILIATGSEVALAMDAKRKLEEAGKKIRVVSMPCWEVFAVQDAAYRESVLPSQIKARVAVEAGASLGWERYVGDAGATVTIDHFGASAPAHELLQHFGFSVDNVVKTMQRVML